MNSEDFKNWRNAMGFTQAQAADALGVSKPTIENYGSGRRREDKRSVVVPLSISLACATLYHRLDPWHASAVNKNIVKDNKKKLKKWFQSQITAQVKEWPNSVVSE